MLKKLLQLILIVFLLFSNLAFLPNGCIKESSSLACSDNNVYNGYWWRGFWVPGYPTQETQMLLNPPIVKGRAVFYGPQVMEGTAYSRGLKITKEYLDGVSLLTCGDIGKKVWLKRPNKNWEGPFLVVDCAKRGDLYGIINYRKEAVEVGFKTAIKWKMAEFTNEQRGKYSVKDWSIEDVLVSKIPPSQIKSVEILSMKDWFNSVIKYTTTIDDCVLRYKSPENGTLPLWRINCEWKLLPDKKIIKKEPNYVDSE